MYRRQSFTPPPATGLAPLDKAVANLQRLEQDHRLAGLALTRLQDQRAAAEQQDDQALADALRLGKPDPGHEALDAVDAELGEARRRERALDQAVRDVAGDVRGVCREHRAVWLADLDSKVAASRAVYADSIDAAQAARSEVFQAESLRRFIAGEVESYRYAEPMGTTLPGENGEGVHAVALLDALRDEAHPPAPKVYAPGEHRPLHEQRFPSSGAPGVIWGRVVTDGVA